MKYLKSINEMYSRNLYFIIQMEEFKDMLAHKKSTFSKSEIFKIFSFLKEISNDNDDEWYYVKEIQSKNSSGYGWIGLNCKCYKCDQIEGLYDLLKINGLE